MLNIKENVPLKNYTTLEIGGPARYFVEVTTARELKEALQYAKEKGLNYYVVAGGSDLLVSESGFDGLVIKISLSGIREEGNKLTVSSGASLQELVNFAIEHGLAGFEKLNDIPGSVGGAIYGNAGAFGQAISDKLIRIKVTDGVRDFWMAKDELKFDYRESILKQGRNLAILEAEFTIESADPKMLQKTAQEVLETRKQKYTPGIKCPGSFFKNLLIDRLPEEIQKDMPKDYYGKVPAWWFLEKVDAKGKRRGKIKIADHHANLFVNEGGGTASDFFALAKEYKDKVQEKFGVSLEPEVQLLGFQEEL